MTGQSHVSYTKSGVAVGTHSVNLAPLVYVDISDRIVYVDCFGNISLKSIVCFWGFTINFEGSLKSVLSY